MRISDWSSDVCSSDLSGRKPPPPPPRSAKDSRAPRRRPPSRGRTAIAPAPTGTMPPPAQIPIFCRPRWAEETRHASQSFLYPPPDLRGRDRDHHHDHRRLRLFRAAGVARSEEHTSELQSLMRISYAVFCLKKKKQQIIAHRINSS